VACAQVRGQVARPFDGVPGGGHAGRMSAALRAACACPVDWQRLTPSRRARSCHLLPHCPHSLVRLGINYPRYCSCLKTQASCKHAELRFRLLLYPVFQADTRRGQGRVDHAGEASMRDA
jgi:hypothetical protein